MIAALALAAVGGTLTLPITVDHRTRVVQVHAPSGHADRALVLLHGAGGDHTFAERTALARAAPAAGVLLAVPDGTGFVRQGWRASPECCGEAALWRTDDVAFLDALASALRTELGVSIVAVAGFSNGGMLAQRWACTSHAVDAVVSVAGPLLVDDCRGRPIPALIAHGLGDANIPPEGGRGPAGTPIPPTEVGLAAWRRRNGSSGSPSHVEPTRRVVLRTWDGDAPLTLVEVRRWGHRWPGGTAAARLGWDLTSHLVNWVRNLTVPPDATTIP